MDKPTIVVNDIAASNGGALTVLHEFYEAVKRNKDKADWVFLLSEKSIEETPDIKIKLLPKVKKHINRILFDSIWGWKTINGFKPSVVVSLQNTVTFHTRGKKITYVHQPLPFQRIKNYSVFREGEFVLACIQHLLGYRIIKSIEESDLTIVQTKWMKKAIEEQCKAKKVIQIYPNIPKISNTASYKTTNAFFYPTSNIIYKNNRLLLNVAQMMRNEAIDCSITITTKQLDNNHLVNYVDRIPIKDVYDYYSKSCLVFPSYIETFGYPLVEARAVGAIILASDCNFSHELLDDYENAYFFDPFCEKSLFELMKKVALGIITRKEPRLKEYQVTENDSWNQVVDIIIRTALDK